MKTIITALFIIFISLSCYCQESFFVQTETRFWNESESYNGYTLFGTRGKSYLIDMEGRVVHTWNIGTNPRFTDNGTPDFDTFFAVIL